MEKLKLGLAICGSFCTFDRILPIAKELSEHYELTVIMSENSSTTDTRFGCAENMKEKLREISGRELITTIKDAEPIGPKKMFDALVVAPCTGNTLAKLACGIADNTVTLACKAHLRNTRPLIIAISTNDALSTNARNIGELLNRKNHYFVPFGQDDPHKKSRSIVADMSMIPSTVTAAFEGDQIQPILL